jgi:hypothetical protein
MEFYQFPGQSQRRVSTLYIKSQNFASFLANYSAVFHPIHQIIVFCQMTLTV